MLSVIEKRKETFSNAIIYVASVKDETGTWKAAYCRITFTEKGKPSGDSKTLDYGNFLMIKYCCSISEIMSHLTSIFRNGIIKLLNYPGMPTKSSLYDLRSIPSQGHFKSSNKWPMLYTSQSIDSNPVQIPYDPLSKIELPLYPNGSDAIIDFFGLQYTSDYMNLGNYIEISIPDYRARISKLRLSGRRVSLEVQTNLIGEEEICAKFFCRNKTTASVSDNIPIEKGVASFVSENEPFIVEAHILSIKDGEDIDYKSFDYRRSTEDQDVILSDDDVRLADIISKGENERVEFKITLDIANTKEFLESIVAFANTKGGTIFIGVDNHCVIKDFREDVKAKIEDLVQGNCDPDIHVSPRPVNIGEHQILLVEVQEGTNKPYTLVGRGIFIRRGSTDRQIKRMELDDL